MQNKKIVKTVRCPRCKAIHKIQGTPGTQNKLICSNCGLKGVVNFPSITEKPLISNASSSKQAVIIVENLTKRYKDVVAVDSISFAVKKGEIFGFLGPNGAGKTTTIRTLLGFLKQDNGEIFILNKNIKDHSVDIRKKVGYIPGELALYEHLTGRQFLEYFNKIRNKQLSLLSELSDIFELPLDKKIKGYSKGMKQKLGIIQAFMDDPEIVIMDEPTSGLDPLLQQKFYGFLQKEKEKGRTMFFSSHILSEVDKICDRVAIIRKGKIVALENIEILKQKTGKKIKVKIMEDPKNLLNSPEVNFINGWLEITVHESLDTWMKKLAAYTVINIEIQEFNLEDYFMRYYNSKDDE